MKNFLFGFIAGAAAMLALCYFVLRPIWVGNSEPQIIEREIIQHDTITALKPLYLREYVRDTIRLEVRDTLHAQDTVFMELPITVREYRDSSYYARVSGYLPQLDYIETYATTKVVERTQVVKRDTHWGIGLQAGYGFGTKGAAPYIGLGVSYNLLTW